MKFKLPCGENKLDIWPLLDEKDCGCHSQIARRHSRVTAIYSTRSHTNPRQMH